MAKAQVVRVDSIMDAGDSPYVPGSDTLGEVKRRLYIGSSNGDTPYESVAEAIEAQNDTLRESRFVTLSARDVTDEVAPLVAAARVDWRYAPDGEVRYIEQTRTQVFAVYRGTLRPSK